ncbi:MAG: hypothetical protein EA383_16540 [Spirochaetaceae bacterium]|nr:MAG: hypothetical protein EA383_16540 [Spirochaetaceae bacterium]
MLNRMKTISIRDMKAHWTEIEQQIRNGESFEVLNRGRPAALIVPPQPREVLVWDDHLETAVPSSGRSTEQTVRADREGRW